MAGGWGGARGGSSLGWLRVPAVQPRGAASAPAQRGAGESVRQQKGHGLLPPATRCEGEDGAAPWPQHLLGQRSREATREAKDAAGHSPHGQALAHPRLIWAASTASVA